ncbi:MAG: DUF4270 family protein [Lacibacter sp.]
MCKWTVQFCATLFVWLLLLQSCQKVDIDFAEPDYTNDPDVTYYNNFETETGTYKVDSFVTSGSSLFTIGYNNDPYMGVTTATSYAELQLPGANPVANASVVFDSLQLLLIPKGNFSGDSSVPFTFNVYRLSQNIRNKTSVDYYNTSSFAHYSEKIGSQTVNLSNKTGTTVAVRLSDALGQELLDKFVTSAIEVSDSSNFYEYFKGICIAADSSSTKAVTSFSSGTETLVRLTYHEKGLYTTYKHLDFVYTNSRQFNRIQFRTTTTNLAAAVSGKSQLLSSEVTGGYSYLNSCFGSYIRIGFPTLLTLKEKNPDIRVLNAKLIVRPHSSTWASPFQLPSSLYLYSTDNTNLPVAAFTNNDASNPVMLTGDLVIDKLYGKDTYYSYDVTTFINAKIAEGQFSQSAILLAPASGSFNDGFHRFILQGDNSVQLQLYVLGL